ncbi:S-methyl-5-thioribose kinase [Sutcliffiella deserti]|uniref:S-methyl-5-thioribose kinase n=1 Tax=Sutcliffiella deserti TaxID=2875501 RepID=UPI001CBF5D86|nr:S-methyl-5-thioribose kinase [Sutcliffiella deserti]
MSIVFKTGYEPLTESTAQQLAKNLGFFEDHSLLYCKEIGDGNLNLVFHIQDEENKSIIIKQALPYAKVVGESWPLTLYRATIEGNYLKNATTIVPNFVPKIYYTDEERAITIMEDLSNLKIARNGLIELNHFPLLSVHIGEYLAKTLFYTSDFGLNQQEKKKLQQKFSNPELCKITEDLVFTDPFFNSDTNSFEAELRSDAEEIWNNHTLKLEVAKLKYNFLTQGEALLHGDLHTGSIFVNHTETKVIDPEFAFFGPMGFDIGQFFANLLFQALTRSLEDREVIFTHLHQTWETFEVHFSELWQRSSTEPFTKTEGYLEHVLQGIFEDTIGFAGCELIRRTIGLAHVADLDGIGAYENKIRSKKLALSLGQKLILNQKNLPNIIKLEALCKHLIEEI